jgi:hypothetical protein
MARSLTRLEKIKPPFKNGGLPTLPVISANATSKFFTSKFKMNFEVSIEFENFYRVLVAKGTDPKRAGGNLRGRRFYIK